MKRGVDSFQTIKTEGAILPSDFLRRLIDGDRDIPGFRAEDYHLAKSERINEVATRAWNRIQSAWEGFKDAMEKLPDSDIGTSLTREKWLLILFQELGYGRLTTKKATEIGGKSYAISHEWQNTPILLVSFRQEVDKRTPGRAGAARVSPHSLVQEFLNRSDEHLWGFVSNGLSLRLLRDNASLTRQAYVEFDLQSMMDSQAYSDFFLLFLLCHQSRVEVPEGKGPSSCWLEKWYNTASQQGVRALDQLRNGVQRAIESLGGGFLAYPANSALRDKLKTGGLSTQDYYRQVLRQVYRLLFLFVAEDRGLLLDPMAPPEAQELYSKHYSTHRIRTLAGKTRGTRHPDLWRGLALVLGNLHDGCETLALPAFGSFLFSDIATEDLNGQDIANSDLLRAIRALAYTVEKNVLHPVNYRNLGPEELGSVYESLLEMHPEIHMGATNPTDRFRLTVAAGSERKTTGSYYTPSSLVNCLLDSSLDPVISEASNKADPEQALLALTVCDPACGSGHFLIAAAHRIAKRLASIRSGEDEPSPVHYQHALRDIIANCIYGVDINPMSVELCKVSLWLEAIEPGRPLSFLDHRIKCGNSLLGTTPALLDKGIPDDALKPIEGDNKTFCTALRRQNKKERETRQSELFAHDAMPWDRLGNLPTAIMQVDSINDTTLRGIEEKEKRYADYVKSTEYIHCHLLADAWCAAFVWIKKPEKESGLPYAITEEVFRRIERDPFGVSHLVREEIARISQQYQFFHWHIEFPDVFRVPQSGELPDNADLGWSGGFDCVLGNPPWERIKLQEKEWFAQRSPEIANAANASARKELISELKNTDPTLYQAFLDDLRKAEGESDLIRNSDRYPLCGRGDVNTYTIFAELKRSIIGLQGRVGCIVPSGIATDDTTKFFFQDLIEKHSLVSLYDFENRNGIFPGVHRSYKFCLLTLAGLERPHRRAEFVFFAHVAADLSEDERRFTLSADDIELLNPNTRTCPIFRSKKDAELNRIAYKRTPVLSDPLGVDPWNAYYMRLVDLGDHRDELRFSHTESIDGWDIPLYESKLIWQFDHRFATFHSATVDECASGNATQSSEREKNDPDFGTYPRYMVRQELADSLFQKYPGFSAKWLLVWRDISNATNERTSVSTIIPFGVASRSCPAIGFDNHNSAYLLHAALNSFAFDYLVRQKVGGVHFNWTLLEQLPVPQSRQVNDILGSHILQSVLELVYTAWDLEPFAKDCAYDGPPFIWDEDRRFLIRAELDAAFFHLYLASDAEGEWQVAKKADGCPHDETPAQLAELKHHFPTPRHAVDHIMETFPIVKRKDVAAYGHYHTKDTILEIYDEMAEAIRTGKPYQTRLDPPPGPPTNPDGSFAELPDWPAGAPKPKKWPPHIHEPKRE